MKAEEIIRQILVTCPRISEEQILNRLRKEQRKTGGLISDETLLRMIAAEFGYKSPEILGTLPSLLIKDLLPGLNDINITGRIVAVFTPRTFEGRRKGKLAGFMIVDQSGILRVVLWNEKTSIIENGQASVGRIARVLHGYTRQDSGGIAELHVGEKSDVEINPQDVDPSDYPDMSKFSTRISELEKTCTNTRINITGTVKKIAPATTFERKDSGKGKVMRFILSDKSGEISIVVWNDKAEELEKCLKIGDRLQLVNAKIQKALKEGAEVNINGSTFIGPFDGIEEFSNVANLKEEMDHANFRGEVATKPLVREVRTSRMEVIKLATFQLKDKTGKAWVTAWRKHAEVASNWKLGDKIIIKNAYVKKGFSDQLEISTTSRTSINVTSSESH